MMLSSWELLLLMLLGWWSFILYLSCWFLLIKCQIFACFGVKLLKKSIICAKKHIFLYKYLVVLKKCLIFALDLAQMVTICN